MAELLNVDQALERVLHNLQPLPAETTDLLSALGRVLAAEEVSEIDLPPFPNSSMDGYAVRADDLRDGSRENPVYLRVAMDIPAGAAPTQTLKSGEAGRIMTGAPMPEGADAVVPIEDTDTVWTPGQDTPLPERVAIYRRVSQGDYVRPAGEDIRTGQRVIGSGTVLRAEEIGVLASLGRPRVFVVRQPRVAILASGDELVDIDQPLAPGKIRNSNTYTLAALTTTYGGIPLCIPVAKDTLHDVRKRFHEALEQKPDIILSSAGVSVGAFDVVRTIIEEMGQISFWRINLRPGKPLAFGHLRGVPFFGLPGNPVSAMVTFDVFVRPALLKLGGRTDTARTVLATIDETIRSDGRRSYLRVTLDKDNGRYIARLTGTQSSGVLTSMVLADGLLIVPENITEASAGSEFPVRLLRDIL